jgi:hypothetical protein
MHRSRNHFLPKNEQLPDVAELMEFPERVRTVPTKTIPQLIGAVELRAAALERLKAELWGCLLGEKPDAPVEQSGDSTFTARAEARVRPVRPRSPASEPYPLNEPPPAAARRLMTVRQFCAAHPAFTEGSLRWLLFNRETNGLATALVTKGRRLWIDVDAFFAWLD